MKRAMILVGIATLLAGQLVRAEDPFPAQGGGGSGTTTIHPRISDDVRANIEAVRAEAMKVRDDAHFVARGRRLEKASYLGLSTTPVTAALRAQLTTLQPYVGLVVESVEKESPAAVAGVEQYDILEQFNDQILIEPRQLGVLVRLAKPGDSVTLRVVRKGTPMTLTAKMTEHDVPPLDDGLFDRNPWFTPGQAVTIQKTREPLDRALQVYRLNSSGTASFNYSDKGMSLSMTRDGDDRHLIAKDKNGKVLFDGPINTAAERKGLPAEVTKRLKEMDPAIFEADSKATTKP